MSSVSITTPEYDSLINAANDAKNAKEFPKSDTESRSSSGDNTQFTVPSCSESSSGPLDPKLRPPEKTPRGGSRRKTTANNKPKRNDRDPTLECRDCKSSSYHRRENTKFGDNARNAGENWGMAAIASCTPTVELALLREAEVPHILEKDCHLFADQIINKFGTRIPPSKWGRLFAEHIVHGVGTGNVEDILTSYTDYELKAKMYYQCATLLRWLAAVQRGGKKSNGYTHFAGHRQRSDDTGTLQRIARSIVDLDHEPRIKIAHLLHSDGKTEYREERNGKHTIYSICELTGEVDQPAPLTKLHE